MKKNITKLIVSLFVFSFIISTSYLSFNHKYHGFLFFALVAFALYLFFSRKKRENKVKGLQIEPKIAEEMAKKIISDAKKHRHDKEF